MNPLARELWQSAKVLAVALVLSLGASYTFAAPWTGPTAAPPGANTPTPLNVGTSAQSRAGALGIGTTALPSAGYNLEVFGNTLMHSGLWSDTLGVTGGASFGGNVGIGTTNPTQTLEVNGSAAFDSNVSVNSNVSINSGTITLLPGIAGTSQYGPILGSQASPSTLADTCDKDNVHKFVCTGYNNTYGWCTDQWTYVAGTSGGGTVSYQATQQMNCLPTSGTYTLQNANNTLQFLKGDAKAALTLDQSGNASVAGALTAGGNITAPGVCLGGVCNTAWPTGISVYSCPSGGTCGTCRTGGLTLNSSCTSGTESGGSCVGIKTYNCSLVGHLVP